MEVQDVSLSGMAARMRIWLVERVEAADRLVRDDVFSLDGRLESLVSWGVLAPVRISCVCWVWGWWKRGGRWVGVVGSLSGPWHRARR